MDALVHRRRASEGTVLFSKGKSFHGAAAHLKDGGLLVIAADQRAGGSGTVTPFLGRVSSCLPLPEVLHRRTGAAVFSLSMKTAGLGKWRIRVKEVPDRPLKTAAVMRAIGEALAESPEDGFWFHRRWRLDSPPLCFRFRKVGGPVPGGTKPVRLLATLPPDPEEALPVCALLNECFPETEVTVLFSEEASVSGLPEGARSLVHQDGATPEALAGLVTRHDKALESPLEIFLNLSDDPVYKSLQRFLALPSRNKPAGTATVSFLRAMGAPADDPGK